MQPYDTVILASWTLFILYWILSSFRVKRDIYRGWWRAWWMRGIVLAIIIFALSHAPLLGLSHRHFDIFTVGSSPAGEALAWLGALLTALGIGLAIWARVHLGRNWSPAPAIKEEHELVTSGPYALVRHPIYTGIILAMFGSSLVSLWWLIIFAIMCAIFVRRVFVEERLMLGVFPTQYPEYKKRTWALFPYVW